MKCFDVMKSLLVTHEYPGYGAGLILCQLLPGREYTGSGSRPEGYDSKLVRPDPSSGTTSIVIVFDTPSPVHMPAKMLLCNI
jgi:hypothetical protein